MYKINEGTEKGDLRNLVHNDLHIDEYKSKMGNDEDICVLSFKIRDREPAEDLVNFIEKGYDWVLDADVSSGEISDGDFLVFVEAERNKSLPNDIYQLLQDVMNLTGQDLEDWAATYPKTKSKVNLTLKNLQKIIPATKEEYQSLLSDSEVEQQLDELKMAAGIPINKKLEQTRDIEAVQIAAGIK